jgi:hypothetical protein
MRKIFTTAREIFSATLQFLSDRIHTLTLIETLCILGEVRALTDSNSMFKPEANDAHSAREKSSDI